MSKIRTEIVRGEACPVNVFEEAASTDDLWLQSGYRTLGADRAPLLPARLEQCLTGDHVFSVVASIGGNDVGAVVCIGDETMSRHFGFACARMDHLVVSGAADREATLTALTERVVGEAVANGVRHLSVRVLSHDFAALHHLQSVRFAVTDTIITHVLSAATPGAAPQNRVRSGDIVVTGHFGADLPELDRSLPTRFGKLLRTHYSLSQFHADPHFGQSLASSWYEEWCRRIFDNEWADGVMIAWIGSDPIGFTGWRRDHLASQHLGVEVYGSGLGASTGHGAYSAMVDAACRSSNFDIAEFDLHVANFPVNRTLGKHQHSRLLRASHALHLWVDDYASAG